jgi:hypothetical protein
MGHPDFRAGGKIFATLRADGQWGTVKLSPEEQREFIRTHPKTFSPASGAWGRQGWTNVRLDQAERAAVRAAVVLAWEGVRAMSQQPRQPKTTLPVAKGVRKRRI